MAGRRVPQARQEHDRGSVFGFPLRQIRENALVREDRLLRQHDVVGVGPSIQTDALRPLIEARREGIYPFCLTVDKEGNDYLRTMMDDFSYEVLADVSLLVLAGDPAGRARARRAAS